MTFFRLAFFLYFVVVFFIWFFGDMKVDCRNLVRFRCFSMVYIFFMCEADVMSMVSVMFCRLECFMSLFLSYSVGRDLFFFIYFFGGFYKGR